MVEEMSSEYRERNSEREAEIGKKGRGKVRERGRNAKSTKEYRKPHGGL